MGIKLQGVGCGGTGEPIKLQGFAGSHTHPATQRHNNLSKGLSLLRSKRSFCEFYSEALLYYDGLEPTA
jgi:hypothetical protein